MHRLHAVLQLRPGMTVDAACEALRECCEYAGTPLIARIKVALTSTKDLRARW